MEIGMLAFCVLVMLLYGFVVFFLPIFVIVKIVQFAVRWFRTGEPPWKYAPPPRRDEGLREALARGRSAAGPATDEVAAARAEAEAARAEAAAARAEAAQLRSAAEWRRRQEERISSSKAQQKLDRIALAYYVEDAMKSGMTPEAIGAALRAKGWPEEEIRGALPQPAA